MVCFLNRKGVENDIVDGNNDDSFYNSVTV